MLGQLLHQAKPKSGKVGKLGFFSHVFVNSSWCIVRSVVIFLSIDLGKYLLPFDIKVRLK